MRAGPSFACDSRHGPDGLAGSDVRTSLRGADGSRPVFSVVATPFAPSGRRSGQSSAANRPRLDSQASRYRVVPAGLAKSLNPTRRDSTGVSHRLSLTVGVAATLQRGFSFTQVPKVLGYHLSSSEMTGTLQEDAAPV